MVVTPLAVPNQIIMPMLPKIIAIQEKMPAKGSLKTFNIKGEIFFAESHSFSATENVSFRL